MKEKDHVHYVETLRFPYIPTFLSFREGEAILCAYAKLHEKPELLMIDGCGINHPRFAGLYGYVLLF
ncbi:deoxyribonuclease V [Candidatus Methanomarinus sp.]|nr:deoxyribonuclease V [ANME-2 cluster archaeon]